MPRQLIPLLAAVLAFGAAAKADAQTPTLAQALWAHHATTMPDNCVLSGGTCGTDGSCTGGSLNGTVSNCPLAYCDANCPTAAGCTRQQYYVVTGAENGSDVVYLNGGSFVSGTTKAYYHDRLKGEDGSDTETIASVTVTSASTGWISGVDTSIGHFYRIRVCNGTPTVLANCSALQAYQPGSAVTSSVGSCITNGIPNLTNNSGGITSLDKCLYVSPRLINTDPNLSANLSLPPYLGARRKLSDTTGTDTPTVTGIGFRSDVVSYLIALWPTAVGSAGVNGMAYIKPDSPTLNGSAMTPRMLRPAQTVPASCVGTTCSQVQFTSVSGYSTCGNSANSTETNMYVPAPTGCTGTCNQTTGACSGTGTCIPGCLADDGYTGDSKKCSYWCTTGPGEHAAVVVLHRANSLYYLPSNEIDPSRPVPTAVHQSCSAGSLCPSSVPYCSTVTCSNNTQCGSGNCVDIFGGACTGSDPCVCSGTDEMFCTQPLQSVFRFNRLKAAAACFSPESLTGTACVDNGGRCSGSTCTGCRSSAGVACSCTPYQTNSASLAGFSQPCQPNYQCGNSGTCVKDHDMVFATSMTYTGNLGDLTGADAICNSLASASTANLSGTFAAWLSDSTTSAASHVTRAANCGPDARATCAYELADATQDSVATSWTDLTDGTLSTAVHYTERGLLVTAPLLAWTGSNSNGTAGASNCTDWKFAINSENGTNGVVSSTTSTWSNNGALTCDSLARLYCIQQ